MSILSALSIDENIFEYQALKLEHCVIAIGGVQI